MKHIYYTEGPARITAGEAGAFRAGFSKPVSDRLAGLLLAKPMFREAGEGSQIPIDDSVDIEELTRQALAEDRLLAEKEAEARLLAEKTPEESPAEPKKRGGRGGIQSE